MKRIGTLTAAQSRRAFTMLLFAFTAIGVIAGSVYGAAHPENGSFWLHQYFVPAPLNSPIPALMKVTFLSSALFIAAAYLTGLFAFGQPFGFCLLIYRGFGMGFSSALTYTSLGIHALPRITLLLLPRALAVTVLSVLAVRELMRSSGNLLRSLTRGEIRDDKRSDLKHYTLKFAVLLLLSLLISFADVAVFAVFARLN